VKPPACDSVMLRAGAFRFVKEKLAAVVTPVAVAVTE
jgi:hypothetical protein